jgi:phage repressor protein C with HTH and peptisase S24 domain
MTKNQNYLHPQAVDNSVVDQKPIPDVVEMAIRTARSAINPTSARTSIPLNGVVSAGGSIDNSTVQNKAGSEYEALIMATIPDAKSAYHVVGMSMFPSYKPDTLIVCGARITDVDSLIGEEAIVEDADGGRYLKIIREGDEPETFNLESYNAPTMANVRLAWAAEIVAVIPARKWLRLAKRVRQIGR